ncbi:uncharacterized protein AFUA_2G17690 [Aspergillus fumigatus Af293]|uniref:Uncharacterized protein n=2 Tax=Aspergillus fumigatus TaxID=746128 RepID=Q4WZ99_ASPFU|nr:hypothetical protein AFUA_2G17690 [Aspergillus fumigatus Af293]EAL94066.1 hypothetical protein AFUA_2G17690 [Aspergillus fumigatus Af293]EDP55273.1 hypothetical protein AFUB_033380 [Aspergillus fumigatus A1163]
MSAWGDQKVYEYEMAPSPIPGLTQEILFIPATACTVLARTDWIVSQTGGTTS